MELQSWSGRERDRHNASSISFHLSSLKIPITPALFSVAVYVSPETDLSRKHTNQQNKRLCTQPNSPATNPMNKKAQTLIIEATSKQGVRKDPFQDIRAFRGYVFISYFRSLDILRKELISFLKAKLEKN